MARSKLLILCTPAVYGVASSVTNYYVDATAGDDDDDGLSAENAWQTIAKVNATAFSAGNRILFKRDETWTGELQPSSNGSAGLPIVYGAYGTGARPIIDGLGTHFGACWIPSDHHHLRFESLDFYRNNDADQYGAFFNEGHDVYVYNCIARSSQYFGFSSFGNAGTNMYNITYDSCVAHDNAYSGIVITSNLGTGGPHDCEVKNCTAYSNGTTDWADHGIYVKYGTSVHDCIAYSNTHGAGIKLNAETVHAAWSPVCYNNTCYNNMIGIAAHHQNALIYNNLLYNNSFTVNLDGDSHDMEFVYNTLVNAANVSGNTHFRIDGTFSGTIFKNNLIIQDAAVSDRYLMRGAGTVQIEFVPDDNTWDYNVYYSDGNAATGRFYDNSNLYSWTQWKALPDSPDANSTFLTSLPGFVTRYTDLHPADGGNLKDLGIDLVGYDYDKVGNPRGDPPTPGCYEEQTGG